MFYSSRLRWNDSFRTKSEEELDKLLEGLHELATTLPDTKVKEPLVETTKVKDPQEETEISKKPEAKVKEKKLSRQNGIEVEVEDANPFPSVKKTRQLIQHSMQNVEEKYNNKGDLSQPYHTMQDSKPFSYIR